MSSAGVECPLVIRCGTAQIPAMLRRAGLLCGMLFVLSFAACKAEPEASQDVLERDRFKELLLQAQLIEARVNHELIIDHISQVPTDRYYAELFERQGVTAEQFTTTFAYYTARPEELKAIYEEIITELTIRKDQGDDQRPAP